MADTSHASIAVTPCVCEFAATATSQAISAISSNDPTAAQALASADSSSNAQAIAEVYAAGRHITLSRLHVMRPAALDTLLKGTVECLLSFSVKCMNLTGLKDRSQET